MERQTVTLEEIKLIGIKVRTGYRTEQDWQKGQISPCVQQALPVEVREFMMVASQKLRYQVKG